MTRFARPTTFYEDDKIREADHFLQRLKTARSETFRYELSAFLSAARSALQYALEEANGKPGGALWYQAEVSRNAVVGFLRDKRNLNIHERPVPVTLNVAVTFGGTLGMSGDLSMMKIDGKTGAETHIQSPSSATNAPRSGPRTIPLEEMQFSYTFSDWGASDDIATICDAYMIEIKRIVADGQARGFLTCRK